ncbi:MAG: DNA repair protein RecN [Oscillospiraceae bacterium]|nr:DNA repair protein RecN [Oscillospiraceae bacterium]
MLKELYIENLAIIEKAVITFDGGFNVFSGETGAGKSILIGGINAVLGGRVSKDIVRAGADKAVVTALFETNGSGDSEYESEKESSGEILFTREINSNGNSIARINGRTTTASELKEIASNLIDIHGQHQTRLLISPDVQLALLDSFGEISKIEYEQAFREFSTVSKKLKKHLLENALRDEKIEILTSKITDLEPYKLKIGEEDEVSYELEKLRNAQNISEALNRSYSALASTSDSNLGACDLLNICKISLSDAGKYISECNILQGRIAELVIEANDIKNELSIQLDKNSEPEKLQKLSQYEERMSDFLRLKRKYSMSCDEMVSALEDWKSQLADLQSGDEFIQNLTEKKKNLGEKVRKLGGELSEKRKQASVALTQRICDELDYLDMPSTRLVFAIKQDKVTIGGMDTVELLIAANAGEEPKPLSKIASGGELSRIMLAIKSVQADKNDVTTMIFDEIDSGISGRAAQKVGLKLSALAGGKIDAANVNNHARRRKNQILCVTHLAQVAALADRHLLIEKQTKSDGRTYTAVKPITGEERKRELARIISGDDDEISLANAERLMSKKQEL